MTRGCPRQIYASLQEIYACMCVFMCWDIYTYTFTISIYLLLPVNKAQGMVTLHKTYRTVMTYCIQP